MIEFDIQNIDKEISSSSNKAMKTCIHHMTGAWGEYNLNESCYHLMSMGERHIQKVDVEFVEYITCNCMHLSIVKAMETV